MVFVYVVRAPGRHLTPGEVPAFLRSRLAGYKIPAYVDVVDDLPRTGSNKVRKGDLRALPLPKRN
ncbi:hypothetical protein [Actinoplanes sp. NPDC005259]|uniref:AMP-binding enzyme n=1 Tax=Actinoplanes sp. NPDC005259 TaxID=3154674 RepID=UPI0033B87863